LINQAAELDVELLALVPQHPAGPALLAEPGVGPVVAAQLLVSWSRGRVRNEAAFASLAGVAPLNGLLRQYFPTCMSCSDGVVGSAARSVS
jgi:transposase